MGALFIFIFISVLIISALLFFNKGEKALEIKSILKDIYENFKELFSNLKKLFLIIQKLIQSKLDQAPTQIKDESMAEDSTESQPEISTQPESVPTIELETSSDNSTESQPEISTQPESVPTIELETSSDVPIEDNNLETKND